MPVSIGNVFLSQYQFFLNLLGSNTTNIFKNIFNVSTEDIYTKKTPAREKVLMLQKPVRIWKKIQNINPR